MIKQTILLGAVLLVAAGCGDKSGADENKAVTGTFEKGKLNGPGKPHLGGAMTPGGGAPPAQATNE